MNQIGGILYASWEVLLASGEYLLLGLLLAALLKYFLPEDFVARHLKKQGFASILKASAFGVPLPLCSCSVIPVAFSLRRAGASKGATASFLVSTPEIGIDSFILSYGLLGSVMAALRMIAAFITAVLVGSAINIFDSEEHSSEAETQVASCCQKKKSAEAKPKSLISALRYAFVDLLGDFAPSMSFGILIAGAVAFYLPANYFQAQGYSNITLMFLMLLAALPTYVCASASTPLVHALMLKGLGVGPALVFLLAGPATNTATILVCRKELGFKSAFIYVSGIIIVSLLAGLFSEMFLQQAVSQTLPLSTHEHQSRFAQLAAGVLLVGLLYFSLRKSWRTLASKLFRKTV